MGASRTDKKTIGGGIAAVRTTDELTVSICQGPSPYKIGDIDTVTVLVFQHLTSWTAGQRKSVLSSMYRKEGD